MHNHLLVQLHPVRVEQYGKNSRAMLAYSQCSVAHGSSKPPACGRNHSSVCHEGSTGCFKYGQTMNFMRECPKNKQVGSYGGKQSSVIISCSTRIVAPRGAI